MRKSVSSTTLAPQLFNLPQSQSRVIQCIKASVKELNVMT